VTVPDEEPPEHFKAFMGLPNNEEHGQYPGSLLTGYGILRKHRSMRITGQHYSGIE
jgi:hypothetical protein